MRACLAHAAFVGCMGGRRCYSREKTGRRLVLGAQHGDRQDNRQTPPGRCGNRDAPFRHAHDAGHNRCRYMVRGLWNGAVQTSRPCSLKAIARERGPRVVPADALRRVRRYASLGWQKGRGERLCPSGTCDHGPPAPRPLLMAGRPVAVGGHECDDLWCDRCRPAALVCLAVGAGPICIVDTGKSGKKILKFDPYPFVERTMQHGNLSRSIHRRFAFFGHACQPSAE